ncbi:hypothetical protein ABW21_db0205962 [Orbilia brochopaga]|nr:hypothetical protein ABW21_db0205962 [Drechslerella brochopaga]
MLANVPRWILFGFILGIIPIAAVRLISIPLTDLYFWADHDAGRTLRDFANAVAYTERLWYRLLPLSLPKGIKPDTVVDVNGNRYADVALEYLLEVLQDQIETANLHFEIPETPLLQGTQGSYTYNIYGSIISNPADRTITAAKTKSQVPEQNREDENVEFVTTLQNMYSDLMDQVYRVRSLHIWIEEGILQKKDLNTWWKDENLIAMSVASARIDPHNRSRIVYDSLQRKLWSRYLAETEFEFEEVLRMLKFFSKLYLQQPLTPSPGGDEANAPDEFYLDLRRQLQKISDWFVGWVDAVAVLRDTYDAIPPLPTERYTKERVDVKRGESDQLSSVWGLRQWTAGTLPVEPLAQTFENLDVQAPQDGTSTEQEYNIDIEDFGISDLPGVSTTFSFLHVCSMHLLYRKSGDRLRSLLDDAQQLHVQAD